MKRAEILTLMQTQVQRLAELGQVVQVAMEATEHTAEDLGALMTAADVAKQLADEFHTAVAGAVAKEARVAGEFERGLRQWSMGVRLLADGLGERSQRLLSMGTQNFNAGAQAMDGAIEKLV